MNQSQSIKGLSGKPCTGNVSEQEYQRLRVENEHNLNKLIQADQTVSIINDVKQDLITFKENFAKSEAARGDLHLHITSNATSISEHATDSKAIQDGLIDENNSLRNSIQTLEVKASNQLVTHNASIKGLNEEHAKRESANLKAQAALKQTHAERVDALLKERDAEQASHQAAMKLNQEQNAAKDSKYIQDIKTADTLLKDTVKQMEARHSTQLKNLKDELQKVSANYVADLKTFALNHEKVVTELNVKLQKQLQQSNEEKARRDTQYKNDLKSMEDSNSKYISDMNSQNAKNLRDLNEKYDRDITEVNLRNLQNVTDKETRHNQLTTDLQKRHQQEMEAIETRYKKFIADVQIENRSNVDQITKTYEDKLTELNELHANELRKYKNLISDQKAQAETNLRNLEVKYNQLISDMSNSNASLIEDMQRTYNNNISDFQQKNRAHVDAIENSSRKQVSDLQESNRQNLALTEQKHADLTQRNESSYRASLDAKDREAQAAATAHSSDLQARASAHNDEVKRLLELNQTQNERQSADYRKRDSDYIASLEQLTKQHSLKMKEFDDERIRNVAALRAELLAANAARDAERKQAQALQLSQESRHKDWQGQETNRHHLSITDLQARYDALVLRMQAEGDALRNSLEEVRSSKDLRINELDIIIKRNIQMLSLKDARILELENLLRRLQDVEEQLRVALDHIAQLELQKQGLKDDLEGATQYISDLEEKYYKSQYEQLNLLKLLSASESSCQEMQNEIEVLRNYIIDLKSRIAVYIPVKNDGIDKRIAEYINNYPDRQKLKIMFMRESEGVYQFGSKRVNVKVDKDKINIRVGGGYLSIDEFLDQYTPAELEKLERKDPMKRFQEKVAVSKTIQGNLVRDTSPDSPMRSSMSPKKRAV